MYNAESKKDIEKVFEKFYNDIKNFYKTFNIQGSDARENCLLLENKFHYSCTNLKKPLNIKNTNVFYECVDFKDQDDEAEYHKTYCVYRFFTSKYEIFVKFTSTFMSYGTVEDLQFKFVDKQEKVIFVYE